MAATENETGEKNQAPTGKRLSMTRADGMIGKSPDLSQVLGMSAAFLALQHIAPLFWNDMVTIFRAGLTSRYTNEPFTIANIKYSWLSILWLVLPHVLLLMFFAATAGAGCTALQTQFNWSWKLVKPKFSLLNPMAGLKRICSLNNSLQLCKSIIKLAIIGPVAYFAFVDLFPQLLTLINLPLSQLMTFANYGMGYIFWKVIKLLLVLSLCDLAYQKWNNYRQIKMTKVEVKDERKAMEGDEETKRAVVQKGMQRIRERMLKAVKKADVIVTNPTHLAIALQYDFTPGSAPRVLAKGRAHLAERIKQIARENGIPIIERKPLARALYKSVEVGHSIPYELYQAVAELLAYVYKLKGVNPFRRKSTEAPTKRNTRRRPPRVRRPEAPRE